MNKNQFENKEVYLWGLEQAKKSLLDKYDKGDQHPNRRQKKIVDEEVEEEVEEVKPKKVQKRVFTIGDDYGIDDLDFLNQEYERIQEEFKTAKGDKYNELLDLEDNISELIEGLEHMKRLSGKGITKEPKTNSDRKLNYTEKSGGTLYKPSGHKSNEGYEGGEPKGEDSLGFKHIRGKGFKKGSPEALEWAKKMREAKEAKKESPSKSNVKKVVSSSKARVEKGSEEAKALGKRMAEAKKKKAEELKKKVEEENAKKPQKIKGKPYYYIGDIPKGYREATMIEAIKNKKVSKYGKYVVDEGVFTYFENYGIILDKDADDKEISVQMFVLKKKTLKALEDIEIYESKLDNDKYKDKWEEYKNKLKDAKDKRKTYNAMFNWYLKIWKERHGGKYERIKLKLPERIIKENYERPKIIEKEPEIDIRTGRPIDEEEDELIDFERGDEEIRLKRKYFDSNMKLKPKRAKQLYDKRILLEEKFYTPSDIKKFFFKELIKGGAIVFRKADKSKNDLVQSVVFHKPKWNVLTAKKWLKDNNYHSDSIDEKDDTIRFRQLNPSELKNRKYISKRLHNDITLIISLKK